MTHALALNNEAIENLQSASDAPDSVAQSPPSLVSFQPDIDEPVPQSSAVPTSEVNTQINDY